MIKKNYKQCKIQIEKEKYMVIKRKLEKIKWYFNEKKNQINIMKVCDANWISKNR